MGVQPYVLALQSAKDQSLSPNTPQGAKDIGLMYLSQQILQLKTNIINWWSTNFGYIYRLFTGLILLPTLASSSIWSGKNVPPLVYHPCIRLTVLLYQNDSGKLMATSCTFTLTHCWKTPKYIGINLHQQLTRSFKCTQQRLGIPIGTEYQNSLPLVVKGFDPTLDFHHTVHHITIASHSGGRRIYWCVSYSFWFTCLIHITDTYSWYYTTFTRCHHLFSISTAIFLNLSNIFMEKKHFPW